MTSQKNTYPQPKKGHETYRSYLGWNSTTCKKLCNNLNQTIRKQLLKVDSSTLYNNTSKETNMIETKTIVLWL